jgi:anti-sigma B factor antagonist
MRIDTKQFKRVDLLNVSGRVDSSNAHILEQHLKGIMDRGQFRIVIDLSEMQFLSSAGIRILIAGVKTARRWNRGDVRLAAVPTPIKETFELAGLTPIFRMFDTTVEAVGSF